MTLAISGLGLPAIAGFSMQSPLFCAAKLLPVNVLRSSKTISVVFISLIIYQTVLATLPATYLGPADNLTCGLDQKWVSPFREKEADPIRRIQKAFRCCGLHSVKYKAWPFPDKIHRVDACVISFSRQVSCFSSWRTKERRAAGLLLLVGIINIDLDGMSSPTLPVTQVNRHY